MQAQATKKTRDWRFELLRIVAMLLIVACHFFASDNWTIHTDVSLANSWRSAIHDSSAMLGQVGVVLFVLISAYFLARNTSSPLLRLVKLWIQVFFYSAGFLVLYTLAKHTSLVPEDCRWPLTSRIVVSSLLPITFNAYWFISAFFVMILLAPFINTLFDVLSRRQTAVLIGIMVWITFIWRLFNPQMQYFTDVAYLCTVFMIGSAIQRFQDCLAHVRLCHVITVATLGLGICIAVTHFIKMDGDFVHEYGYPQNLLTAGSGASPIIAVAIATTLFIHIVQGKAPQCSGTVGSFILKLAPATFGVYLIHENFLFKPILWHYVFSSPEPQGAHKLVFAVGMIALVYAALLTVSFLLHRLIIKPITDFVASRIIAREVMIPTGSGR